MSNDIFKNIPSVNELLENPTIRGLYDKVSRHVVVDEVRTFLDGLRDDIKTAADDFEVPRASELADKVAKWIVKKQPGTLRPVVNATGILLHTGLGRAPLANEAVEAMAAVASGYASLEVDTETGNRSQRVGAVENLLRELTGAEAATVVNNNAGATLIALAALAGGREVVVSRGHLIEIGGSYRLPEVMAAGGARLREVGTTNKTRLTDFAAVCGEETGALLRVHPSNFRIVGFTAQPSLAELVTLGNEQEVYVIDDIGSGALIDFARFGLSDEPLARESIAAGVDVALFSGDKLLGGPQCGILVGKREAIEKIQTHPLARALRVDKMTLAALQATLKLYRDPTKAEHSIPLLSLLATSAENLQGRAERLMPQVATCEVVESCEVVADHAQLGGGSVPAQDIPTWCLSIAPAGRSVDSLAHALRTGTPSVFGRVQKGRLLLDLRTVTPAQDVLLLEALDAAATAKETDE